MDYYPTLESYCEPKNTNDSAAIGFFATKVPPEGLGKRVIYNIEMKFEVLDLLFALQKKYDDSENPNYKDGLENLINAVKNASQFMSVQNTFPIDTIKSFVSAIEDNCCLYAALDELIEAIKNNQVITNQEKILARISEEPSTKRENQPGF